MSQRKCGMLCIMQAQKDAPLRNMGLQVKTFWGVAVVRDRLMPKIHLHLQEYHCSH